MLGRDLLSIGDLSPDELDMLIRTALAMKRDGSRPVLEGKTVAMLFEKPSLRTRVSFEVGMKQLGGSAIYLSQAEVGLGQREPVKDVARVLSRYVSCIVARTYAQKTLYELADAADVPVVNALSDDEHPCQALADLLTVREHKGRLAGVRIAYIGDGNNVAASLSMAAALCGAQFVIAAPEGYSLPESVLDAGRGWAKRTGGAIESLVEP
ncbi:MAG TPA: ornithine carbamoyltransferase, partial [Dehalococcoidia bacterium]|nr:ornithine carbamoyltransferase [Dehalococcoidia bacterium]